MGLLSLIGTGLLPIKPCRLFTDFLNSGKVPLELRRDVAGDSVLRSCCRPS